jgi:hypothetical protein
MLRAVVWFAVGSMRRTLRAGCCGGVCGVLWAQ